MNPIYLILTLTLSPTETIDINMGAMPYEQCEIAMQAVWNAPVPQAMVYSTDGVPPVLDAWCSED